MNADISYQNRLTENYAAVLTTHVATSPTLKQINALTEEESLRFSSSGLQASLLEDQDGEQVMIDGKSRQGVTLSEKINGYASQLRSRFSGGSDIVTIMDLEVSDPTIHEVLHLLKSKKNTDDKWLSIHNFFKDGTLLSEFSDLWSMSVDIFRTVIIFGYCIPKPMVRKEMLKNWFCSSYQVLDLPSEKTVHGHLFQSSRWIKLMKYKLAAFASWAKDSDVLPKSCMSSMTVNPSLLVNSGFRSFLLRIKKDTTLEGQIFYMSLVDTLARGVKKGAARSSDDDCIVSNLETFDLFTTPKPKPTYLDIGEDEMIIEIERSVDEIIGNLVFEPQYTLCPSFSSCTEVSLREGGHVAWVKQFIPCYPREPLLRKRFGMLSSPFPLDGFNDSDVSDPVCREKLPTLDGDLDRAIHRHGEMKSTPYLEISTNPDNLGTDLDIELLLEQCMSSPSVIRPVALKEALKVRGITTPSALETWLLKPLQKFLSKALLQHLCFAVTGETLKPENLSAVIKKLEDDQVLVSGDYDNATNNMIGSYTRACITKIVRKLGLSDLYLDVAIRSLCDNVVEYKYRSHDSKKIHTLRAEQCEAQPMGKILSFTILCIINFTVCRKALEIDRGYRIRIKDFPGLINGDDCCFPIKCFEHWVGCAAIVGLFNSIGKTFTSRHFVEMNSRTFIVKQSKQTMGGYEIDPRIDFHEVPFINFGLMKGLVRSAGGDDDVHGSKDDIERRSVCEAVGRMGWCHQELVKGFDGYFSDLDYLFKFYNNKYLLSPYLKGIPYYVPQWLGGIGLKPNPNPTLSVSDFQRSSAKIIFQNFNNSKHSQPKSIGLEKSCLLDLLFHRFVDKHLDLSREQQDLPFSLIEREDGKSTLDLVKANQEVYSMMIEYLWRSLPLDQFFKELGEDFVASSAKEASRKLYHNQKLWIKAYQEFQTLGGDCLEWFRLWHKKILGVIPIVPIDRVLEYKNSLLDN